MSASKFIATVDTYDQDDFGDWIKIPKEYGHVYIDWDKKEVITPTGIMLVEVKEGGI